MACGLGARPPQCGCLSPLAALAGQWRAGPQCPWPLPGDSVSCRAGAGPGGPVPTLPSEPAAISECDELQSPESALPSCPSRGRVAPRGWGGRIAALGAHSPGLSKTLGWGWGVGRSLGPENAWPHWPAAECHVPLRRWPGPHCLCLWPGRALGTSCICPASSGSDFRVAIGIPVPAPRVGPLSP